MQMNIKLLTGISLAIAMAGCATTPLTDPALESARTAVRSAEADPNVAKYAALDLQAAQNQLQIAETAAIHRDASGIDQPAYLAQQNAKLAQLHAQAKADDALVAAGQTERDQIQLAARTREVAAAEMARKEAEQKAAQQAAELQAQIAALKAKPTDRGLVLTLGDVLFDTGKAQLNPGAARNLDQLVAFLHDHPERHVEIDGYTDNVGSDSYNLDLSQRRADAVRQALVSQGIDPSRIVTKGYGKEFAVASNSEASGRQLNRRVEVVIGGASGEPVAARGT
jgi:outer membrane protein OmpA-like peptidoglycan-associated protein